MGRYQTSLPEYSKQQQCAYRVSIIRTRTICIQILSRSGEQADFRFNKSLFDILRHFPREQFGCEDGLRCHDIDNFIPVLIGKGNQADSNGEGFGREPWTLAVTTLFCTSIETTCPRRA